MLDTATKATWTIPEGLAAKLRPHHRILLASWDAAQEFGRVHAFAICEALGSDTTVYVEWAETDTILKPKPSGATHWRTKDFFKFADAVVDRYGLDDLFAEHLSAEPTLPRLRPHRSLSNHTPQASSSRNAIPGHIYFLKSPYGYKIGKTVNLRDRMRLFGVKLPFVNSLEYSFHTPDYTAAETGLHRHFAHKRLEGEWFALDEADLQYIKQSTTPLEESAS
ncbi:GIY-YIG nuclease family protein [Pigmentiphaga litoralis]|uniref:GIY-YIG nuclease family protein n=1 Tax=Pigmentiphaga litoralis TaxID=516702 RepID=UPI0016729DA1|nr:GIY-YIG nuclease family protein [Pigmentiphaga litoralis]